MTILLPKVNKKVTIVDQIIENEGIELPGPADPGKKKSPNKKDG